MSWIKKTAKVVGGIGLAFVAIAMLATPHMAGAWVAGLLVAIAVWMLIEYVLDRRKH